MSLSRWLAFPIPLSMRFSVEQHTQLRKGLSAKSFDDKWLGTWDAANSSLVFSRSWTGLLVYVVPLKVEHGVGGGCACSHFWVSLASDPLCALVLLPSHRHRAMVSSLLISYCNGRRSSPASVIHKALQAVSIHVKNSFRRTLAPPIYAL